MSYFKIVTENPHNSTTVELDFQAGEFGIAQATFQALSTRKEYSQVTLHAIGPGEKSVIVADKRSFMDALAKQGMVPPSRVLS
ncbi:MAG TPA: hypothetical protein VIY48_01830 [Candidatus Paceibacterota bacterium]